MGGRDQFTVGITCPHCAQPGAVVWEENTLDNRKDGIQRTLVRVPSGFHVQDGTTASGDPLIVCDRCGTLQPD
jgi:Zn ribbon nucleic-acid-binding protein